MWRVCYCVTVLLLFVSIGCVHAHSQVTCTNPSRPIPTLNNSKADGTISVGGCYNPIDGSYQFGGTVVGTGNLTKVITAYGADGGSGFYTAASMNSGSKTISFNAAWATPGLKAGATLVMSGAGIAGADLVTTVTSYGGGSTITVNDAASTTASFKGVWWGKDDSSTFATALAECATINGCTIFVPPGGYVIAASPITIPSISGILSGAITIQCLGGRQATRFIGATGNLQPIIQTAASNSRPVRVLGCGFESFDPTVKPNIAVKITTGIEHLISDNWFGGVYNGVYACGSFINKIEFNRFYSNYSDSIRFESCNASGMNYNIIRDNEFGGSGGWAYYDLSGGDHNSIEDNDCEGTQPSGCFYIGGTYHKIIGNRQEVDNTGGNVNWRMFRFRCLQLSNIIGNTINGAPSAQWAMEFEGDGSCSSNTNAFFGNQLAPATIGTVNVGSGLGGFTGNNWFGNVGDDQTKWGNAGVISPAFYNNQFHCNRLDGCNLGYFGMIPANSGAQLPQRKAPIFQITAPNGGGVPAISALNSGSSPVNRRQPQASTGAVYQTGDLILDTANGASGGLDAHLGWVCVGNSNCTFNGSTWSGGTIMQVAASVCIVRDGTTAPASGTYSICDRVVNTNPSELGSAGSKYVVQGWICTAAGTPGTWLEQRTLTGN